MITVWLLINIYLSIWNGSVCNLGQPVDYYKWTSQLKEPFHILKSFYTAVGDAWLIDMHDGRLWLFVFDKKIDEALANGESVIHGKCFRRVG